MSATPPPKNSLIRSFFNLPPRQRMTISATLMVVSLAGLYVSDRVERALVEQQERENRSDLLGLDLVDRRDNRASESIETRGSSTDRVRLEERSRK